MADVPSPRGGKPVILVTGGAGYIGSHVVLALLDAGYETVVLDNLSTGSRALVDPRATFVEGEAGDTGAVTSLMQQHGVRGVVHLAAFISVEGSLSHPLDYYRNNTAVTVALLQSCVDAGVTAFVFSSTAAVYGDPPEPLVTEALPPAPQAPYGASKLMSERILADTARAHGLRNCALRYFNVAGADPGGRSGQRSGASNLIKVALDTAIGRREVLPVFGNDFPTPDGSGVRDYIHVTDLAAAHVLVLQRLLAGSETPEVLNCGYGRGHSVFDVIAAIEAVTGKPVPWQLFPRRAGDLAAVVADSNRIKNLGWQTAYDSLDAIVEHAWNWELSQQAAETTAG